MWHPPAWPQVGCIATDPTHEYVALGDSLGHIRVWDVRDGVDVTSSEACKASFKQVSASLAPVRARVYAAPRHLATRYQCSLPRRVCPHPLPTHCSCTPAAPARPLARRAPAPAVLGLHPRARPHRGGLQGPQRDHLVAGWRARGHPWCVGSRVARGPWAVGQFCCAGEGAVGCGQ